MLKTARVKQYAPSVNTLHSNPFLLGGILLPDTPQTQGDGNLAHAILPCKLFSGKILILYYISPRSAVERYPVKCFVDTLE